MTELSDPITLRLPLDVLSDIERVAGACERTRSWVMVRAMKFYLASHGEGGQVLSIVRGREEADAGGGHDFDEVMAEIEAMIQGDDT